MFFPVLSLVIETDYVILHGTPYWTDMFVRHFLFETDQSIDADDLLFFVRKRPVKGSTRFLVKFEVNLYLIFQSYINKFPIKTTELIIY
jgi:hypothetical protein